MTTHNSSTVTSITTVQQPSANTVAIMPPNAEKDVKSRLTLFTQWLDDEGAHWNMPDLAAYRDYLMGERGLSAASAAAHLSTVRGRYRALLDDNATRQRLYDRLPSEYSTPADQKAAVDEALIRLENGINPRHSKVTVTKEQDVEDGKHVRLTQKQAGTLIEAPFNHRHNTLLQAVRDAAMIALMLCTGVREMELIALDVTDLRTEFGGELALRVRKGKGAKARSIPYGELDFCLAIVDRWLQQAGISEGAVFRGFYKGGKRVRSTRLTLRAVNQVLERYSIMIGGKLLTVNPHDLRRTYARRLYDAGTVILAIQQNLGHANHKTTEGYIGTLDASKRRAPAVYSFDMAHLGRLL